MPDVLMPRLSDTMAEGTLSQWLMAEGDEVHRGDVLAEIETDKATMDLEAFDEGTLTRILVPAGTTVPIGQPVAVIGDPSGTGDRPAQRPTVPSEAMPAGTASDTAPVDQPPPATSSAGARAERMVDAPGRVRATPLVRALAREHRIDLSTVTGTGPRGRIVRVDIDAAIAASAAGSTKPSTSISISKSGARTEGMDDDVQVPLSAVRRITAERLTQSAAAPHFYLTSIVDAAPLVDFCAQINTLQDEDEGRISLTDLLIRACAVGLRAHPEVNSSWGGDHIVRRGHVNVGLAVAIDDGLIVPVIRDTDRKAVREISTEAHALIGRARAGGLKPEEFSGGTFTISNLGMFGISEFTAVINPPEAAILAVGTATEEPVVVNGEVKVTTRMRLTLTVDHRVLDGATGAMFLNDLVHLLEQPLRIVT